MAAPNVADLGTLISQYQSAFAPEQANITNQITQNDQSGQAQAAGLQAKQTQAFGNITQQSNDRGAYFSGFTPDAEAKYTASTYLPALANLQSTIAATRGSLLGKSAALNTSANTSAINEQKTQQQNLQTWQNAQDAAAHADAARVQQENFQAGQNNLNRQAQAQVAATAAAARVAATNPAKGFGVGKTQTGGLSFHGPNGQPVTAAQYASATGGNISDILSASSDPTDQAILQQIHGGSSYGQLAQKYPWVFGGI